MNPHFVTILRAFHDGEAEYLVIGAHALADLEELGRSTDHGGAAG
jgi:hypothetical protein